MQSPPVSSEVATAAVTSTAPVIGTDRLILVFDYRSLIESEDVDMINYEAWTEVLESFGYGDLTYPHFMRSLVLKSPSEVMTALCPYTTKAEWGPILNKRTVRLNKDISALCYAEMLPIIGVKDFILDCVKKALTTCIFLSPFPDDVTRRMLELAEIGPYVDLVHSYVDREFALLEALEMINIRPPRIPDGIEHRWSDDEHRMVRDAEGNLVKATTGSDEVSRSGGILNPADVIVFATDTYACASAAQLGCKVIGVTYNGGFYGYDEDGTAPPSPSSPEKGDPSSGSVKVLASSPTSNSGELTPMSDRAAAIGSPTDVYVEGNHREALLFAGASAVVEDYSQFKFEYLQYLREPLPGTE